MAGVFLIAAAVHGFGDVGNALAIMALALAFAAPSCVIGKRLLSAGLWVSAETVVVRGPLKTRTVATDEVQSFDPGVLPGGNGTPCVMLRLKNGTDIGIWALGREGLIFRFKAYLDELRPACDQLNALLDTLR